ncbi:MAG TPA: arylsulfatase [Tepidisphaeraceae bacterium]|jgi:arylsulfatase|nr:arylsulfatase [Tepidisphaeraceae bacterium]
MLRSLFVAVATCALIFAGGCQQSSNAPSSAEQHVASDQMFDRTVLPIPPYQKVGKLAPEIKDCDPIKWPVEVSAPKGAPNVLLVMMDDVGFGATDLFGGAIPTPTYDNLAKNGLKYNNFFTTAVCSCSRASLITGRNHHIASTGIIMEFSTPYPGYHSLMSKSVGTIGEILKDNGYGTAWFGKNHNVPDWETSPAGPFSLWPTGLGFDYFYGFLGADAHQFRPAIYENIKPVDPYLSNPDKYILNTDLANHAINWIHMQKAVWPDKPFLAYYTPGTDHAPHHASPEWIAKFKGKFDMGWDELRKQTFERQKQMGIIPQNAVLNPTPPEYMRWDSLSPEMKKVCAREMECYAGALAQADYETGRVVDSIKQMGELDNTLIIYIQGDNGASAEDPSPEGMGLTSEIVTIANHFPDTQDFMIKHIDEFGGMWMQNHFARGWAHAMNTPFQWDKKIASHLGGSKTSMVVSWPARIKQVDQMRSQFVHITDIVPTILEAAHLPDPVTVDGVKQVPMNGTSFMYTFDNADAPEQHTTQYFEVIANRAIYDHGWIANTTPVISPWSAPLVKKPDSVLDYKWELYNLKDDFSQSKDLAAANPQKLEELKKLFDSEAVKNKVFPLDDRYVERVNPENRPKFNVGRTTYTYYPGTVRITEAMAPNMKNCSYSITADVTIPENGAQGIMMTQGGYFGGNALLLLDGKPTFLYAASHYPDQKYKVQGPDKVPAGKHIVKVDFKYDGGGVGKGGMATLFVDDKQVAQGRIDRTVPVRVSADETLDIGEDSGTPITRDYQVPFEFTGAIEKVVIKLEGTGQAQAAKVDPAASID